MKTDTHPEYMECQVRCSCGNTFTTRATKPSLRIELCNECHPFYTGQQKYVDTGGRVQRFSDKYGSASEAVASREAARREARAVAAAEAEAAARSQREQKSAAKAAKALEFAEKTAVVEVVEAKPTDEQAVQQVLASAAELSTAIDTVVDGAAEDSGAEVEVEAAEDSDTAETVDAS
ncbi:MAG: 50S ribosomal protein L31 [Coriobacteriales bacterium]|nr:50S ribosomal protein L31 [Coriobacteriales bacterium]